jgi:hypothetical protein
LRRRSCVFRARSKARARSQLDENEKALASYFVNGGIREVLSIQPA